MSHKLQPCGVAALAPLKNAYRNEVDRLERGGVGTIGKELLHIPLQPLKDPSVHA